MQEAPGGIDVDVVEVGHDRPGHECEKGGVVHRDLRRTDDARELNGVQTVLCRVGHEADGAAPAPRRAVGENGHAGLLASIDERSGRLERELHRSAFVDVLAVAELTVDVGTPVPHGAARVDGQGVEEARRDLRDARNMPVDADADVARRAAGRIDAELSFRVAPPRPDRAVVAKRDAVIAPRRYIDDAVRHRDASRRCNLRRRHRGALTELCLIVATEAVDLALRGERDAEAVASGGSNDSREGDLHRQEPRTPRGPELAARVVAPRPQRAVGADREHVLKARRDLHDAGQPGHLVRRRTRYGAAVPEHAGIAPRPDASIGVERDAGTRGARHLCDVGASVARNPRSRYRIGGELRVDLTDGVRTPPEGDGPGRCPGRQRLVLVGEVEDAVRDHRALPLDGPDARVLPEQRAGGRIESAE